MLLLLMLGATGCGNRVERATAGRRLDALGLYKKVLDYLQQSKLIPHPYPTSDNEVPVFVYDEVTCMFCGSGVTDFVGYDEVRALARSIGHASPPASSSAEPCRSYRWPALQQLSTTKDTGIMIRFDQIDSTDFAPLKMVGCLIYDNAHHYREPVWGDPSDEYYYYGLVFDANDSIIRCYGGRYAN